VSKLPYIGASKSESQAIELRNRTSGDKEAVFFAIAASIKARKDFASFLQHLNPLLLIGEKFRQEQKQKEKTCKRKKSCR
jgi:hypothetical protein